MISVLKSIGETIVVYLLLFYFFKLIKPIRIKCHELYKSTKKQSNK